MLDPSLQTCRLTSRYPPRTNAPRCFFEQVVVLGKPKATPRLADGIAIKRPSRHARNREFFEQRRCRFGHAQFEPPNVRRHQHSSLFLPEVQRMVCHNQAIWFCSPNASTQGSGSSSISCPRVGTPNSFSAIQTRKHCGERVYSELYNSSLEVQCLHSSVSSKGDLFWVTLKLQGNWLATNE